MRQVALGWLENDRVSGFLRAVVHTLTITSAFYRGGESVLVSINSSFEHTRNEAYDAAFARGLWLAPQFARLTPHQPSLSLPCAPSHLVIVKLLTLLSAL